MFLGIDIAKDTCDAALIKEEKDARKPRHKHFANTAAGHRQLLSWLADHGAPKVHACLEATGTYGEALTLCLFEAGHTVSVVNPARISAFAKSQLQRSKTDKADAHLIARFCQTQDPPASPFPQRRGQDRCGDGRILVGSRGARGVAGPGQQGAEFVEPVERPIRLERRRCASRGH